MDSNTFSYGSEWYKWDLHVHTASSFDYKYKGKDADKLLAKAWHDNKISAVVITDHFVIDYGRILRLRELAGDITILPGFEMRTDKGASNLHVISIFSEKADLKLLSDDFAAILMRDKAQEGETNENLYRKFDDIISFTKERKGLLSIHAGAKINGIDEQITNSLKVAQAIKIEIARNIDIFEIGKMEDILNYKSKVFTSIKEKPLVICSDNHDPRKYEIKEYLWIKASPSFEGLKQTIYEPSERISIEHNYPYSSRLNCLSSINLQNVYWFPKNPLILNKGLVTIMGARGSGKTALLDLIAVGLDSYDEGNASFIKKAQESFRTIEFSIDHSDTGHKIARYPINIDFDEPPKAKYLSQQFVEKLCSEKGASDALLNEIEKFVFNALPIQDRYDKDNFSELRSYLCSSSKKSIENLRNKIAACSNEIANVVQIKETKKIKLDKYNTIKNEIEQIRKKFPSLNNEVKKKIILEIANTDSEINKLTTKLTMLNKSKEELKNIEGHILQINAYLSNEIEVLLEKLEKFDLTEKQKALFCFSFPKKTIDIIREKYLALEKQTNELLGERDNPPEKTLNWYNNKKSSLSKGLSGFSVNEQNSLRLNSLLASKQKDMDSLNKEIKSIDNMSIDEIISKRSSYYKKIFFELTSQAEILQNLYNPLSETLQNSSPDYQPLSFYIRYDINIKSWATEGESLIDLRKYTEKKAEPLQGKRIKKGTLYEIAKEYFADAWKTCNPEKAVKAMEDFADEAQLLSKILKENITRETFANWLYSTDHIKIHYEIKYEDVSIEQLSPGTKGIVLMILFLKLDQNDNKPLLIDQPEDNLDPESVYNKLVPYFREARKRRQILMVTHNPNLVVGTDSDQVIVAKQERVAGKELPVFSYFAGGLEESEIIESVCSILEGGREAFEKRRMRFS
jgi:ABC-type lipoprotein export system ATPase subunit